MSHLEFPNFWQKLKCDRADHLLLILIHPLSDFCNLLNGHALTEEITD
ncbi:MAG: hypothetical protein RI580_16095 [Halothece sp. Uz-M2-17]|nr:hypothetical protein [Halothece sp. Uz-M2-17]